MSKALNKDWLLISNDEQRKSFGSDAEERKETEQLPFTKDLQDLQYFGASCGGWAGHQPILKPSLINNNQCSKFQNSAHYQPQNKSEDMIDENEDLGGNCPQSALNYDEDDFKDLGDCEDSNDDDCMDVDVDEAIEMKGIDRECNDVEKNVAHNLIRRSVVRKKLNWSQQFNKGAITQQRNERLEVIQKTFQETQQLNQLLPKSNTKQSMQGSMLNMMPPGPGSCMNPSKQLLTATSLSLSNPKHRHHAYQMSQPFPFPPNSTNFPSTLQTSSNAPLLIDLSLAGKDLKFITPNLLSCNLKLIDLQNNRIETLPDEICLLKSLEKLNIDQNQIKKLPSDMWQLTSLTSFSARNNCISELPLYFESLSRLEILLINDNKIKNLPARIGQLQNLKKLFIHHNLFEEIPIEISRLQKLREFSLEWFIYLNPPMPKIMRDSKGLLIIDQVKTFCRQFTPAHLSIAQALESQYRSFGDFLLYFHQIRAQDINSITFGIKKRGIVHQLCINSHTHLFQNLVCPSEGEVQAYSKNPQVTSSSSLIKDHIDLNLRDKEGSTPICFAFRANNQELIDLMTGGSSSPQSNLIAKKVNMDIVSPKFGCPLHLCILKHKFILASKLLGDNNNANPHITNPNGSNAIHILFANYQFDSDNAETLALSLLSLNVNLNLIDNNGLSPLHVAIKKSQLRAIQFADMHNKSVLNKRDLNLKAESKVKKAIGSDKDKSIQKLSSPQNEVQKSTFEKTFGQTLPKGMSMGLSCWMQGNEQMFEFNVKGKKGFTPLHYAILKGNYEAFLYLLKQNLSNIFVKDDLFRSPRNLALINSPFYKILYRLERRHAIKLSLGLGESQSAKQGLDGKKNAPMQQRKTIINKQSIYTKSMDFNSRMHPFDERALMSQMILSSDTQHSQLTSSISYNNHNTFENLKHQNLNRRHMNKTAVAAAKSKHISNFHSVSGAAREEANLGGVISYKQKGRTLDRLQAQKIIEQIQGGLNNHIKMITEQDNQKRLSSIPAKLPTHNPLHSNIHNRNTSHSNQAHPLNPQKYHQPPLQHKPTQKPSFPSYNQHASQQQQHKASQENCQARVVNNIIIQNINVNLNINISIPPSPRSTRGNGSRIETIQSIDDKEQFGGFQNKSREFGGVKDSKRSMKDFGNMIIHDIINESVRHEDLSVIDDEMPIQNQIQKNLLPNYNPATQLKFVNHTHQMDKYSHSKQNQQMHDFDTASIKQTPRILNNIPQKPQNPNLKSLQNPDLNQFLPPNTSNGSKINKKLSYLLKDECSHLASPQAAALLLVPESKRQTLILNDSQSTIQQQLPSHQNHLQTQHTLLTVESTFKGLMEENTKRKIKSEELYLNQFNNEFNIIMDTNNKQSKLHEKYRAMFKIFYTQSMNPLYQADAIQLIQTLLESLDMNMPLRMDLFYLLSLINHNEVILNDFLPTTVLNLQKQSNLIHIKADQEGFNASSIKNIKPSVNCQNLLDMECINALHIREVLKKRALEKYPQKSQKLHQYLKNHKSSSFEPINYHQPNHNQHGSKGDNKMVFQYYGEGGIRDDKYNSGGSDTIEEIYDITTERTGGINYSKLGHMLSSNDNPTGSITNHMQQQPVFSPNFARKEIIFNQIRSMKIQINQNQNEAINNQKQNNQQQTKVNQKKNDSNNISLKASPEGSTNKKKKTSTTNKSSVFDSAKRKSDKETTVTNYKIPSQPNPLVVRKLINK